MFPITLFPEGGLAGSIITTVWVGVFVMCFFNLRFGWVLSGLVVPGYLVPLLIVKPFAALVISVEAVLAYLIVWLFSEKLAPGRFPSLFGRDRFMGLILASIAVRLTLDGFVLPEFAGWLEDNFDRRIDWKDNLQSFGLVVISLMANQFWKPGLRRGIPMAIVTIGLTYLIVRFGLMEITNFRISGVYYLYEGLATSILAGPKAYIILILTAMIASYYNVKYGWDFSGILIPALIALQWYQPTKILTSFGEAIIIYCIARAILKLPILSDVTLEGGRKLLLFFNISFAWKMALGWYIIWQGLDVKTTDYFGFGYLLSTLIAIKAHDKDIFPRVARSTLQVSLAGAVFGNFIGFTLSATTARLPWLASEAKAEIASSNETPQLNRLVVNAVGDAYLRELRGVAVPLASDHKDALSNLIELFEEGIAFEPTGYDNRAEGWRVKQIEAGRIAIIRDDGDGAELLIFDPSAKRDIAVILPDPTATPGMAVAAGAIQSNQQARWIVLSAPPAGSQLAQSGVVETFLRASRSAHILIEHAPEGATSRLSLRGNAAPLADVSALRRIVPDLDLSLARENSGRPGAVAQLSLNDEAIDRFAAQFTRFPQRESSLAHCRVSRRPDELSGWTSLQELAFARFEIAAPMFANVRAGQTPMIAAASARIAQMDLRRCRFGSRVHWSLNSPARDEGNIFVAEGEEPEKTVLTFENTRSMLPARIGTAFHQQWGADALFIATRSDSFLRSPQTVFDVVWQEWTRGQETIESPVTFQFRARPLEAVNYNSNADVLVAKDRIGPEYEEFNMMVSALRRAGLRAELIDNSPDQAGLEARPGMSARYLNSISGGRHAYGWVMFPGIGAKSRTVAAMEAQP